MNIIRAENIQPTRKEKIDELVKISEEYDLYDNKSKQKKDLSKQTIMDEEILSLMDETIEENKIKVEITLTKSQYELWKKKGEEKWMKQILTNRILKKGKKK